MANEFIRSLKLCVSSAVSPMHLPRVALASCGVIREDGKQIPCPHESYILVEEAEKKQTDISFR